MNTETVSKVASLCARCDSASGMASHSLEQLALQQGPRNRAKWKREHTIRVGELERTAHALLLALWVQPHAEDTIPASLRQHAASIHSYAIQKLNVLRS